MEPRLPLKSWSSWNGVYAIVCHHVWLSDFWGIAVAQAGLVLGIVRNNPLSLIKSLVKEMQGFDLFCLGFSRRFLCVTELCLFWTCLFRPSQTRTHRDLPASWVVGLKACATRTGQFWFYETRFLFLSLVFLGLFLYVQIRETVFNMPSAKKDFSIEKKAEAGMLISCKQGSIWFLFFFSYSFLCVVPAVQECPLVFWTGCSLTQRSVFLCLLCAGIKGMYYYGQLT